MSTREVCSNGTRVFVHRRIRDAFMRELLSRTSKLRIDDPLDPETQVGSLISREHMQMVLGAIDRATAEGARLAAGGMRVTSGACAHGFFVAPTVFDGCADTMTIVRQSSASNTRTM
jgi:betaine-aldehyde dehydrogenase